VCGFAGFLNFKSLQPDSISLLKRMGAQIAHRGDDDSGVWCDPEVGVGISHQRLAIIDLSPEGSQPMVSVSGRFIIAYNGEIYNHQSLRGKLVKEGVAFRGGADTEVLLASIEAWGLKQALQRTIGMFAFVLWDRKQRVLTLVRDRMGEKPLYYGWQSKGCESVFLFGSELKALRQHPLWQGGVDRDALASLLRYNYIPAPQTIHPNIFKLSPGKLLNLTYENGTWHEHEESWWSFQEMTIRAVESPFSGSRIDAIDQLDQLLREVVGGQCVADVPIGAFLSGGIDSSSVVGIMQALTSSPVNTFTIGFENSAYDESVDARRVADYLGTEHKEWIITENDAISVIPDLPQLYDEPFADASQIPTLLVSRLARSSVTVALSGDGGDELFAGYNRHLWAPKIMQKIDGFPLFIRRAIATVAATPSPHSWDVFFQIMDRFLPSSLAVRHPGEKIHKIADILHVTGEYDLYSNLTYAWKTSLPILKGRARDLVEDHKSLWDMGDLIVDRMTRLDTVTYLPDDILVKVDRAAMSVGLESRVPFLDHRVVEFAAELPLSMKIHNGDGKWILRQLLSRYMPSELIDRPKNGFGIPIHEWLRGELRDWAEDLLSEQRLRSEGYFDVKSVRNVWERHLSGKYNLQYSLWGLLMFQAWNNN